MPNSFTPEQIAQILEEFFKTVGARQYIGARYVPLFGRKDETSIEWDNTKPYEPLTVVLYQGNSYTSRQYVPAGVQITNEEFWAITGNYNTQIEQYRRETARALQAAQDAQGDIDTLLPKTDFSADNTVKDAIDSVQNDIDVLLPKSAFSAENTVNDNINLIKNSYEEHIEKSYFIEDFEGETREDKFYSALDSVAAGVIYVGKLSITKEYVAKSKDYRKIVISNGTIDLEYDKFFNQSGSTHNSVPTFNNCAIDGNENAIYNSGENCIGATFNSCLLQNVTVFNSATKYIQSLELNGCVLNPVKNLVTATTIYDMHMIGCKVESASGTLIVSTGQSGFVGCSIEGTLIEGRSGVVISCDAITHLSITGCYFESNLSGLLVQNQTNYACHLYVSNNVFLGEMANADYMFTLNSTSANLSAVIKNNVFEIANKYISNLQKTFANMLDANMNIAGTNYKQSCFAPNRNGKYLDTSLGFTNGTFDDSDSTWNYEIALPYGEAYTVMTPFIVIFNGSYGVNPRRGGLIAACIPYATGNNLIAVKCTILSQQNKISESTESDATIQVVPSNTAYNAANVTLNIKIGGFTDVAGRFFILDPRYALSTILK